MTDNPPTPAAAREQLHRIAAGPTFNGADALRRLLAYLGDASLDGRAEHLKEYTVGVEALGRPPDYDPRSDSSARMLAARLRRKLEDYYRAEGTTDPIIVGFPKGGFRLTFGFRDHALSRPTAQASRLWKIATVVMSMSTALLTALLLLRPPVTRPNAADSEWTPELETLWRPFLDDRTPLVISHGSPLFANAGRWVVRRSELNTWEDLKASSEFERLRSNLQDPDPRPNWDYVGMGDVQGAFRLARLLSGRKQALSLKRGSALSWEDMKQNHLVFIGGGKNQENLRDLLADRDFTVGPAEVRNLKPHPGEPALFARVIDPRTRQCTVDYALVTLLPGLERGRHILVLSASTTQGIWGAVEAVTNARYAPELTRRLKLADGPAKPYQAVLRIELRGGVPIAVGYVTHHLLLPG